MLSPRVILPLVGLMMCGTSCHASSLYDGMRELASHYVNVLNGQESRPPTKVRLALVGLPRTGSGSLVRALQLLGYTTLHAEEYLEVSELFAELTDEADPLPMDVFADRIGERGFDAVFCWDQDFVKWAAANDDVKMILTVRDTPKKWAESFGSVGMGVPPEVFSRPFIWWKTMANVAPILRRLEQYIPKDETVPFEQTYKDHITRVQDAVTAFAGHASDNKLLVFNAKQGWAPICQFLGLPQCLPISGPFPHTNERFLLQLERNIVRIISWIWPLFPALCVYVIWMAVYKVSSQFGKNQKQPQAPVTKKFP